jgi:hypothetical protein
MVSSVVSVLDFRSPQRLKGLSGLQIHAINVANDLPSLLVPADAALLRFFPPGFDGP